tara:strand:- start:316 stop:912 length:597 start_codon:yes stop_codon:yes gene_type:complete
MTSKLIVNSLRHTGASSDAITMDASGNVTFPGNATCSGTPSGFGGITMADQWRITATYNASSGNNIISSNWERNDNNFAQIGSGMTESSGIFTFPTTGIYFIMAFTRFQHASSFLQYGGPVIYGSTNSGSNYTALADAFGHAGGANFLSSAIAQTIFDVTNASTFRMKMHFECSDTTSVTGSSSQNQTGITFIKLGDT